MAGGALRRGTDGMLIAGTVCPHPPLLIPAALGAAAGDPPAELRKVPRLRRRPWRGWWPRGPT